MASETADRTHPNVTLAVLALGGLSYAMLSSLVVPALPTMERELHTTETGITWLLTGYLVAASLLGVGIGLAFAALGNLIVQAVPSHQTGVASGVNTVMRTLGGALGGQLSATFIAEHTAGGLPTVTGFTETFLMATGFLVFCFFTGLLVPKALGASTPTETPKVTVPEGAQA